MVFTTKYFTPIRQNKEELYYIVRTVNLDTDSRPIIEDTLEGFLLEECSGPFEDDKTSYLVRKLSGVEFGDKDGRLPRRPPESDPTEEYEAVGSINAKSLNELITELKSRTEKIRQKQMQESRDKGYFVCETDDFEYKQGRR